MIHLHVVCTDPERGVWTAWQRERPDVIATGESEAAALGNLLLQGLVPGIQASEIGKPNCGPALRYDGPIQPFLDEPLEPGRIIWQPPAIGDLVPTGERRYPQPGEYYRWIGDRMAQDGGVRRHDCIDDDFPYPANEYEILRRAKS